MAESLAHSSSSSSSSTTSETPSLFDRRSTSSDSQTDSSPPMTPPDHRHESAPKPNEFPTFPDSHLRDVQLSNEPLEVLCGDYIGYNWGTEHESLVTDSHKLKRKPITNGTLSGGVVYEREPLRKPQTYREEKTAGPSPSPKSALAYKLQSGTTRSDVDKATLQVLATIYTAPQLLTPTLQSNNPLVPSLGCLESEDLLVSCEQFAGIRCVDDRVDGHDAPSSSPASTDVKALNSPLHISPNDFPLTCGSPALFPCCPPKPLLRPIVGLDSPSPIATLPSPHIPVSLRPQLSIPHMNPPLGVVTSEYHETTGQSISAPDHLVEAAKTSPQLFSTGGKRSSDFSTIPVYCGEQRTYSTSVGLGIGLPASLRARNSWTRVATGGTITSAPPTESTEPILLPSSVTKTPRMLEQLCSPTSPRLKMARPYNRNQRRQSSNLNLGSVLRKTSLKKSARPSTPLTPTIRSIGSIPSGRVV